MSLGGVRGPSRLITISLRAFQMNPDTYDRTHENIMNFLPLSQQFLIHVCQIHLSSAQGRSLIINSFQIGFFMSQN